MKLRRRAALAGLALVALSGLAYAWPQRLIAKCYGEGLLDQGQAAWAVTGWGSPQIVRYEVSDCNRLLRVIDATNSDHYTCAPLHPPPGA